MAGDGRTRPRLEGLVDELGLRSRVRVLGEVEPEAVADLYGRAAVACVASRCGESFGYAAAEPMAMERCVVALNVGAVTELLSGDRGYLATAPTSEALRNALEDALADPAGRVGRAAAGARFADEHFTIERAGEAYRRIYAAAD